MSTFKSIGADVEIFAYDEFNKNYKSLCGMIGGTKDHPKQIKSFPKGFMLQEDNVSLEYNIPPVVNQANWIEYHTAITKHITNLLLEKKLSVSMEASASFPDSELLHPNAIVFGCEPDYDAWKKIENKKPYADNKNLRTAGGHIHVGTDMNMLEGIKQMDLMLGIPSVILDDSPSSKERRKLYGKAGAMRPKPYGFEYRVLSNFWIFNPELLSWVYTQTKKAIQYPQKISSKDGLLIQKTINSGDKDAAKFIINNYGLTLPTLP